jgi:hypothetical protein
MSQRMLTGKPWYALAPHVMFLDGLAKVIETAEPAAAGRAEPASAAAAAATRTAANARRSAEDDVGRTTFTSSAPPAGKRVARMSESCSRRSLERASAKLDEIADDAAVRLFRTGLGSLVLAVAASVVPLPFGLAVRACVVAAFAAPAAVGAGNAVRDRLRDGGFRRETVRAALMRADRIAYRIVPPAVTATLGLMVVGATLGVAHYLQHATVDDVGGLLTLAALVMGAGTLFGGGVASAGARVAFGGGGGGGGGFPCPDDKLGMRGMAICPTCDEIGKVGNGVCPRCHGAKYVECARCGGTGTAAA